jgi:hypothetical protein
MVAMSGPADGSTVTGTVTVSATASDNTGVVGVRFTLDGQTLNTEDTTSPYSTPWNTATATNGTHTLAAVARDAAGNTQTATSVTVNVQNTTPPPGVYLFGDQAIETGNDQNAAGQAEGFQTTSANTGTVTRLSIYVATGSASTKLTAGLYTDVGNHPGQLLTQATLTAPKAAAWNDVQVPAASVTAGTKYWIVLLSPQGSGQLKFRDKAGTTGLAEASLQTTLAALPQTWSSGARYTDGPLSGYAAGTLGGALSMALPGNGVAQTVLP